MIDDVGDTVIEALVSPAIGFVPTVEPVPHSYEASVPKVPLAVRVVFEPLHIVVVPVIAVGATEG